VCAQPRMLSGLLGLRRVANRPGHTDCKSMVLRDVPPMKNLLRSRDAASKAAALIIVLAFVVLLTGLSLAYFSSTTTDRQLAHSSYNDTSADLLARSALDIVVGDFKQEIVNGSSPTPAPPATPFYMPLANGRPNVVPVRSGHPNPTPADETTDPIPNLIRRSIRLNNVGQTNAMPTPGMPSRASAVNSATDASANLRSISLARWNRHYLIPRDPSATGNDSTPVNTFVAPDWVLVTRAGPTPFASWNATLKDSTNNNYAIGRYAYVVYDEGGLLDMNVAGYPSPTPAVTDIGRKGVLAFADLTALPSMTQAAVNKFALFRNYATMGATGTLDSPNFTPGQVSAFVNYYLGGTTQIGTSQDFGQVNAVSSNGRTDQSFINRAGLIDFVKSTSISVNTLQYLGTFSREQNKPSFQFDPRLPVTFTRVVVPQRFYLGNLNEVVSGGNAGNIRQYFGLQFAGSGGPSACVNQVRWKYVGQGTNTIPLSAIPPCSDLTALDFFQYINYALFGVTASDPSSIHFPFTLQIGASIIDQYDNDSLITGIHFTTTSGSDPNNCDGLTACITFGADGGSAGPQPPLSCVTPSPTPPPATPPPYVSSGVFLNRPFRSVGEFSYAYNLRNAATTNNGPTYYLNNFKEPWKSSGNRDPALLDFFTYNKASVRSGIVSLNTRQPRVLAALLTGAIYHNSTSPPDVVPLGDTTAGAIRAANDIVKANYSSTNVFRALSRADIAALSLGSGSTPVVTTPPFTLDDPPPGPCSSNCTYEARETIARALAEVVQTRTWGLLIDLVAQTGHYAPNATDLPQFVVEGEKRYWLHVAIDRFDGTIVGQQLEEVTE
jgi:hypothetical protein